MTMPTEPMTEQQMREYLESVWENVTYTVGNTRRVDIVTGDHTHLFRSLESAVEYTERRREEIRQKEGEINALTRNSYAGFEGNVYVQTVDCLPATSVVHHVRHHVRLCRILAVLESQLTELRQGLKKGAFRGN